MGNAVVGFSSAIAGYGVYGYSNATSVGYGVTGQAAGANSYGVQGQATGANSYAVNGFAGGSGSYAGYFDGNANVTGTLTGGTKSFKIDHPLNPSNKYLYHTSINSPDMKNVYDGVINLDQNGDATITMPDWFEALNSDYRYQLTSIGTASPNLHIGEELKSYRFKIAGGLAGQKVSWQITGIRQDAYARAFRSPVEQNKTGDEKGKYIHPELFGQPKEKSIGHLPARPRQRYASFDSKLTNRLC